MEVLKVYHAYIKLFSFKETYSAENMGMAYNTLENNLAGKHDPKVGFLMHISETLFPDGETEFFPNLPPAVANSLTESEMNARLFSAWLGGDAKKVHRVADLLHRLADKELPSLTDLLALKEEHEAKSKKKKAVKKDK